MRIAHLNMVHNGSTGKIMLQISDCAREKGHQVKTYTPTYFVRGEKNESLCIQHHFSWGSRWEAGLHYYMGTAFGINGMLSYRGTRQLISDLKKFEPDIIHLHNLHAYCINLPLLFRYIKKEKIKIVWTLHDCWTFTGHCPHFSIVKCNKWKKGCYGCPQLRIYPKTYIDTTKIMYNLKKKWFCGVDDMVLVCPSKWLANLVEQSFLKEYPVKVINNGIDLSIFKPIESDFREKYNCVNKKIILGVAFDWGYRKGIDVFIELSRRLGEEYQIVLVGTNEKIDLMLPKNILSLHSTDNQVELAKIYSAADLFINPTREDNYPTVNMEAIACGTPVITFRTGGSPEIIDETCGNVVECNDIEAMEKEIRRISEVDLYSVENCLKHAKGFDMNKKFKEYVDLYEDSTYST